MTDKWVCQTITRGDFPMCSVTALMDLRDLLMAISKAEDK